MIWLVLLEGDLLSILSIRTNTVQFHDCRQLGNHADTHVTEQVTRLIGYVELSSPGRTLANHHQIPTILLRMSSQCCTDATCQPPRLSPMSTCIYLRNLHIRALFRTVRQLSADGKARAAAHAKF